MGNYERISSKEAAFRDVGSRNDESEAEELTREEKPFLLLQPLILCPFSQHLAELSFVR